MVRDVVRRSVVERLTHGDLVVGEAESIRRFLHEFDRLEWPFDVFASPVHVTGSAIVVGDDKVLLLLHKRLDMWMQPGGHIDRGESPWQAALREAEEETGLDLELVDDELIHVDVHPGGRGHLHLDLRYLVRVRDGRDSRPRPPEGESQEVYWFEWDEAAKKAGDARLAALLVSLANRLRRDEPVPLKVADSFTVYDTAELVWARVVQLLCVDTGMEMIDYGAGVPEPGPGPHGEVTIDRFSTRDWSLQLSRPEVWGDLPVRESTSVTVRRDGFPRAIVEIELSATPIGWDETALAAPVRQHFLANLEQRRDQLRGRLEFA